MLDLLPRELASIDEPEERATEYLHYRQFFSVWGLLDRVVECQSLEASLMNKDTRIAWLKDYKVDQHLKGFRIIDSNSTRVSLTKHTSRS